MISTICCDCRQHVQHELELNTYDAHNLVDGFRVVGELTDLRSNRPTASTPDSLQSFVCFHYPHGSCLNRLRSTK